VAFVGRKIKKILINYLSITFYLILNYLEFFEFINAYLCSFIIFDHYEI